MSTNRNTAVSRVKGSDGTEIISEGEIVTVIKPGGDTTKYRGSSGAYEAGKIIIDGIEATPADKRKIVPGEEFKSTPPTAHSENIRTRAIDSDSDSDDDHDDNKHSIHSIAINGDCHISGSAPVKITSKISSAHMMSHFLNRKMSSTAIAGDLVADANSKVVATCFTSSSRSKPHHSTRPSTTEPTHHSARPRR